MRHFHIIKELIKKYDFKTYLEIGCDNNECFNYINNVNHKVGVDPNKGGNVKMTSDEFFNQNNETFDIIFIDGLHHSDQVYKDIINSINILNGNGVILCHDLLPKNEKIQRVPRETSEWTGDCWKAWFWVLNELENYNMFVIDTDYGIGYIEKGINDFYNQFNNLTNLGYNFYLESRNKMNIKSLEDFKKQYL